MASKTITTLVDDLDGSKAEETLAFALDGASYEIDLSKEHAEALREALDPYIASAREAKRRAAGKTTFDGVDSQAVRAWARSNGVTVSARGRIPASVVARFRAAGN